MRLQVGIGEAGERGQAPGHQRVDAVPLQRRDEQVDGWPAEALELGAGQARAFCRHKRGASMPGILIVHASLGSGHISAASVPMRPHADAQP